MKVLTIGKYDHWWKGVIVGIKYLMQVFCVLKPFAYQNEFLKCLINDKAILNFI